MYLTIVRQTDGELLSPGMKHQKKSEQTEIDRWMKAHTIHDMEDIVTELASNGEDVSEMARAVHDLEEMVDEEKEWEQQQIGKRPLR